MVSLKSLCRQSWTKLGLTRDVVISMLKNTIPSTAALWVIQSTTVGQKFDTVGFLPIIVTILLAPSLPRIPYLRLLIFTVLLNCICLCFTLLAGYCSTQARLHTTPVGSRLDAYNSSAAAVSGVWLVFAVWALQTFRTYNPQRAKSVILCTIFTEVSIITCCTLSDMASVVSFNVQLFEMFLLGYAFSAFTSLFIFPKSSRKVTSEDVAKIFDLSQKATAFEVPFGDTIPSELTKPSENSAANTVAALLRTFAKFQIDVSDAKKDIGWSQFTPKDFNEIVHHFRMFTVPLRGLFAAETVRNKLSFDPHASQFAHDNTLKDPAHVNAKEQWDLIFEKLQEPMLKLRQLTEDAINHCRASLHMPGYKDRIPTTTSNGNSLEDTEKTQRDLPGGSEFIAKFEKQINEQKNAFKLVLMHLKDQDAPLESAEDVLTHDNSRKPHSPTGSQGRLLFALYVEYLYDGVLEALLQLAMYCDANSATSKPRLQLPGKRRLLKVIRRLIDHHHIDGDLEDISSEIPDLTPQRTRPDESRLQERKSMTIHRVGDSLDKAFEILGSSQSFFGFRVACAVMSIVIVGFLEQTQQWFFNKRGVWAAIFIPFSMAPSSGEAKSMLLFRVLGTLLSIPISLVNWYIVNGVPAGVIVFYFILAFIQQYFIIKYLQWGSFWRPCIITYSIIVGYSLQAKHSDVPQPPATTTDAFPIYLIGPYRGLCTLVGVAVAYAWTVFPKPTSANQIMRQRLGQALFGLAEYHSCMHWAIKTWAKGNQGDMRDKNSAAHKLMKSWHRLFVKETAILTVILNQYQFASYDITLGGARPEDRYVTIAEEVDRIMSFLNVIISMSANVQTHRALHAKGEKLGPWDGGVSDLLAASKSTSKQLASLIHILASSVINDQPLPPFLEAPESFAVARKLRQMRPDLMDVKHAHEEGFKAFAVIEVSVAMITKSLDKILLLVRDMIGEVGIDIGIEKS